MQTLSRTTNQLDELLVAQMSGNAAKEISEMLQESTQKVETIMTETKNQVEVMVHEGKEKVEDGIAVGFVKGHGQ